MYLGNREQSQVMGLCASTGIVIGQETEEEEEAGVEQENDSERHLNKQKQEDWTI